MSCKYRVIGVLLCLLFALGVGCAETESTTPPMSGFMVQPGLVMVSHPTQDTTVFEYATGTTVQGLFNSISANEGFRIALLDANGTEVTDSNTLLTNQMTFAVYEGENTQPLCNYPLQETDPVKVRRHYANVTQ